MKKSHLLYVANFCVLLVCISTTVNAAPVCWDSNGHCYEVISTPGGISWDSAKTSAELSSYLGVSGHLVTLTSLAENEFVWTNLGVSLLRDYWLGGFQVSRSIEPSGGWQWVSGETWSFTNWNTGEPNNLASGKEDKLEFAGGTSAGAYSGKWNDELDTGYGVPNGYIIEYATTVPIPPAVWLFGPGLLGLVGISKRTVRIRQSDHLVAN